jgi:hypothetical protein
MTQARHGRSRQRGSVSCAVRPKLHEHGRRLGKGRAMERKTTSPGISRRTLVAGMAAAPALVLTQGAVAQQNPVTAIDIALEPDATMIQHAKDANARLLKSFSKGFALDETHHPHVTMLQQFVRTDDAP